MDGKVELTEKEKNAISSIDRIILSSISLRDTYPDLVSEMKKVMDFNRMSIVLLTGKKDLILTYVVSDEHEGEVLKEGDTYPIKGSVVERLSATREPVIIDDTVKGELKTDSLLLKTGIRSRLCYPLIAKNKLIGSVNFSSRRPGNFSEKNRSFLDYIVPLLAMAIENTLLFEKIKEESIRDPLTGVYNRRYLFERLKDEVGRAKRAGLPLGVLMCDINHFKRVNDRHGHEMGDKVLQAAARVMQDVLRNTDILCRYGGDEFVIILPDTARRGTLEVVSKLNRSFFAHSTQYLPDFPYRIELSVGVATYPADGETADKLLSKADHAMYKAKQEPGHLFPPSKDPWEEQPEELRFIFFNSLASIIDIKDRLTHRHSQKVSQMAVTVARELGLAAHEVNKVQDAALVHDIGKLTILDKILNKPGQLTEDEWNIMKGHVTEGLKFLRKFLDIGEINPLVAATHENYDGSGYPNGLSGDDIPIGAKIIAVVHAYLALITRRPYRPARTREEALKIIRTSAGKQYDPRVVETFVKLVTKKRDLAF